jgi:hypothetical protein
MEAANTSKTSVKFYQTRRRNNPGGRNVHGRRHLTSDVTSVTEVTKIIRNQETDFGVKPV